MLFCDPERTAAARLPGADLYASAALGRRTAVDADPLKDAVRSTTDKQSGRSHQEVDSIPAAMSERAPSVDPVLERPHRVSTRFERDSLGRLGLGLS